MLFLHLNVGLKMQLVLFLWEQYYLYIYISLQKFLVSNVYINSECVFLVCAFVFLYYGIF